MWSFIESTLNIVGFIMSILVIFIGLGFLFFGVRGRIEDWKFDKGDRIEWLARGLSITAFAIFCTALFYRSL